MRNKVVRTAYSSSAYPVFCIPIQINLQVSTSLRFPTSHSRGITFPILLYIWHHKPSTGVTLILWTWFLFPFHLIFYLTSFDFNLDFIQSTNTHWKPTIWYKFFMFLDIEANSEKKMFWYKYVFLHYIKMKCFL